MALIGISTSPMVSSPPDRFSRSPIEGGRSPSRIGTRIAKLVKRPPINLTGRATSALGNSPSKFVPSNNVIYPLTILGMALGTNLARLSNKSGLFRVLRLAAGPFSLRILSDRREYSHRKRSRPSGLPLPMALGLAPTPEAARLARLAAQYFAAAFRAISFRCSSVSFRARAAPPNFPSCTAGDG